MEKIKSMMDQFMMNEKYMKLFRYLVAGVLTTLVSFSVFWLLHYPLQLEENLSNILSIIIAVIFAYFVNKFHVFRSETGSVLALLREMTSFALSRGFSFLVEVGGVFLLATVLKLDAMLSKATISVLVIILNYIISKFYVFKDK